MVYIMSIVLARTKDTIKSVYLFQKGQAVKFDPFFI